MTTERSLLEGVDDVVDHAGVRKCPAMGSAVGRAGSRLGGDGGPQAPTYEEALRRIGLSSGHSVLEVGCGSGVFLELAARRGAMVAGIDASEALAELARDRVPGAEVRVGDMEHLPYANASFDVVCGFNSFFFADDMTAALREAARVARPGAAVILQVWGRSERCGIEAAKAAIGGLLPGSGRGEPPPF